MTRCARKRGTLRLPPSRSAKCHDNAACLRFGSYNGSDRGSYGGSDHDELRLCFAYCASLLEELVEVTSP